MTFRTIFGHFFILGFSIFRKQYDEKSETSILVDSSGGFLSQVPSTRQKLSLSLSISIFPALSLLSATIRTTATTTHSNKLHPLLWKLARGGGHEATLLVLAPRSSNHLSIHPLLRSQRDPSHVPTEPTFVSFFLFLFFSFVFFNFFFTSFYFRLRTSPSRHFTTWGGSRRD